jgi:hypothetical protein
MIADASLFGAGLEPLSQLGFSIAPWWSHHQLYATLTAITSPSTCYQLLFHDRKTIFCATAILGGVSPLSANFGVQDSRIPVPSLVSNFGPDGFCLFVPGNALTKIFSVLFLFEDTKGKNALSGGSSAVEHRFAAP